MFCKRAALALLVVSAAGCARKAQRIERIAILRFENLSGDPSRDWIGRILSDSMTSQLAGAPGVSAISTGALHNVDRLLGVTLTAVPGVSSERSQALLAGATRIGSGYYTARGGKLEARLALEDAATGKVVASFVASAGDAFGLADALGRRIAPGGTPYGTRSPEAAREWATALEAPSPETAETALQKTIAADPSFGPARLLLAQWKFNRQDPAGAEAVLREGLARSGSMPAPDRARLELESAAIRGDREAQRRALEVLGKATPADPFVWRTAADVASARHDYPAAIRALKRALELEPRDVALLNALGYAAGSAGDLKTADEALDRYAALRPKEANPYDSRGDVHLHLGRYADAEKFYLEAHRRDPAFLGAGTLYKAAFAHLLTGDTAGADAIAKRYMEIRESAKDPAVEYRKAEWSWISGRRREAFERLEAAAPGYEAGGLRDLASRAYAQLAIWSLALGDRERAGPLAAKAMATAGPTTAALASLTRFLTLPPASASEWAVRAEQAYGQPAQAQFKDFARTYALLLAKEFAPAALLLRQLYDSGTANDPTLPVLLAWSYLEAGKTAEAAPLLALTPVPSHDGGTPLSVMSFPRVFYLRGLLAEKQGRPDEAKADYRTFLQLSGPMPLAWGEEKRAAERIR